MLWQRGKHGKCSLGCPVSIEGKATVHERSFQGQFHELIRKDLGASVEKNQKLICGWNWRAWHFSCGLAGKESTCNVGDLDSIPRLGRSSGEGNGYPLQYSGLENSTDCIVHGVAKSQTRLSDSLSFLQTSTCCDRHLQMLKWLKQSGVWHKLRKVLVIGSDPRTSWEKSSWGGLAPLGSHLCSFLTV